MIEIKKTTYYQSVTRLYIKVLLLREPLFFSYYRFNIFKACLVFFIYLEFNNALPISHLAGGGGEGKRSRSGFLVCLVSSGKWMCT
jgi:hypothetical protein